PAGSTIRNTTYNDAYPPNGRGFLGSSRLFPRYRREVLSCLHQYVNLRLFSSCSESLRQTAHFYYRLPSYARRLRTIINKGTTVLYRVLVDSACRCELRKTRLLSAGIPSA